MNWRGEVQPAQGSLARQRSRVVGGKAITPPYASHRHAELAHCFGNILDVERRHRRRRGLDPSRELPIASAASMAVWSRFTYGSSDLRLVAGSALAALGGTSFILAPYTTRGAGRAMDSATPSISQTSPCPSLHVRKKLLDFR